MPDKLTQAEFIARAKAKHGVNTYDYSQASYGLSREKVTILCPKHGPFQQRPALHLFGQGCSKCGDRRVSKALASTATRFIQQARQLHRDYYGYGTVTYLGSKHKVTILCPKHGPFQQLPNSHLLGSGCHRCSAVSRAASHVYSQAEFIARSENVHGVGAYDYSRAVYTRSNEKLTIACPEHGAFEQSAASHLRGSGCHRCWKSRMRLGWICQAEKRNCTLYLLKVCGSEEIFYKVGITCLTVKRRYSCSSNLNGYSYEILAEHKSRNATAVWDWEQSILETFAHLRYKPIRPFAGETECFSSCEEILSIFPL